LAREPEWQESLAERFIAFAGPEWHISSSEIRRMIHNGQHGWQKWLANSVAQFILEKSLYH
jgi:nicotinic acid mononucleotide adenylyltransferase